MTKHTYRPKHLFGSGTGHVATSGSGTIPRCSCGWTSGVTHTFPARAREDWEKHCDDVTRSAP